MDTQDPARDTLAWMRERVGSASDNTQALGNRISTWLVVGNAAAAVFTMKAAIDGTPCDQTLLQNALTWFLVGLGFAFVGLMIGYLTSIFGIQLLYKVISDVAAVVLNKHIIDDIERKTNVILPDDHELWVKISDIDRGLPSQNRRLQLLMLPLVVVMTLMLLSAGALAMGAASPIFSGAFDSCLVPRSLTSDVNPGPQTDVTVIAVTPGAEGR